MLHLLNAYEEGDEIVLDGYFQENPTPRPREDAPSGYSHMMAYLDEHSFRPELHRWRFNLRDRPHDAKSRWTTASWSSA